MCLPKTQKNLWCCFVVIVFSIITIHSQERLIDSSNGVSSLDGDLLYKLIDSDSLYKATMLLNETLLFAKKNSLTRLQAESSNGLGIVFSEMGNYKNAETFFNNSLLLLDSISDPLLTNYVLSGLANNYLLEKDYKKFDRVYRLTKKLSAKHNSVLEFVNLENEIRKNYYQSNNDTLKKLTEYGLNKLKLTNFSSLNFPRPYPKDFKLNLEKCYEYYDAIAQVKLAKFNAKGFDGLFAINEEKLKLALGENEESYRKLATFNYYKYLYYSDIIKNLDSANKYLLKSDSYKYIALRNIEKNNTKNGRLIHHVLKAQDKLLLAEEMHKRDVKVSTAYLIAAIISFVFLVIACWLFFVYYKARKNIEEINTQLKDRNQELQKIDKDRLEFFSILSHELRTPIYGITGLANLMEKETSESKKQSYLSSLISSSNYISVLIDNILQATKLRFSEKTLNLKPAKINDIVQNVVSSVKVAAENKGLQLQTHIGKSDEDEFILIDKVAFTQILINLAYNAIRYTKEGFVSISINEEYRTNSHVKLLFEVKDSGIGIKEEHRETVFNAFDNKLFLEKNSSGSGLGLYIVKTLLKSYNTNIDFTSIPNQGSNFYFSINFEICKQTTSTIPNSIINYQEKQHVLVVDDNKINLLITRKNIEMISGYTCDTSTSGNEALKLIKQKQYDLILLDINMPEKDGYEVSEAIRASGIDTPIIALTALNSREVIAKAEASGMNQVITKPYSFDDFKTSILSYADNKVQESIY